MWRVGHGAQASRSRAVRDMERASVNATQDVRSRRTSWVWTGAFCRAGAIPVNANTPTAAAWLRCRYHMDPNIVYAVRHRAAFTVRPRRRKLDAAAGRRAYIIDRLHRDRTVRPFDRFCRHGRDVIFSRQLFRRRDIPDNERGHEPGAFGAVEQKLGRCRCFHRPRYKRDHRPPDRPEPVDSNVGPGNSRDRRFERRGDAAERRRLSDEQCNGGESGF